LLSWSVLAPIARRSTWAASWFRKETPTHTERDLDRVVLRKVRQLGNRIVDLFASRAALPDVEIAHVERVWPTS
jgi:hypothetical protein